jgi:hypothetical protein
MKFFVLILLLISFVSAGCVDINSASLDELDEIVWVGPATAQKIIDARPFDDVDNLDKVGGIGEVKVSDIKEEGLACVDELKEDEKEDEDNNIPRDEINIIVPVKKPPVVISLNNDVKDYVKSDSTYISKNAKIVDWLPYGFALFLIFIICILLWERF